MEELHKQSRDKLIKIDEMIDAITHLSNQVPCLDVSSNDLLSAALHENGSLQKEVYFEDNSYLTDRKITKREKIGRLLKDNAKLKEQMLQLETAISVLSSKAISKENKLQGVINSQKGLEKALAKKVAEINYIASEQSKYKENAFNRIVCLEEQCSKLTKKVTQQSNEIDSVKEKYLKLKNKVKKPKEKQMNQTGMEIDVDELFKNTKDPKELLRDKCCQTIDSVLIDKSTTKIEMRSQNIQVGDFFDSSIADNIVSDLFFIPAPSSSSNPTLPDLGLFDKYSRLRNIFQQTQTNENTD